MSCKTCNSTGAVKCPQCDGKGKPSGYSYECDHCKGSGVKKCGVCDGKG